MKLENLRPWLWLKNPRRVKQTLLTHCLIIFSVLVMASVFGVGEASAACGCNSMEVNNSAGTYVSICSNQALNFPAYDRPGSPQMCTRYSGQEFGCNKTYVYNCPVGVNNAYTFTKPNYENFQHFGFRPYARLTEASRISECRYGQGLQETITSNKVVEVPRVKNTPALGLWTLGDLQFAITSGTKAPYPGIASTKEGNPLFGGDSYSNTTTTGLLMEYNSENKSLQWWDNTDQTLDSADEKALWEYRFISFVQGTDNNPSCACTFDIDVDWTNLLGPPTTSVTYRPEASTNCQWH